MVTFSVEEVLGAEDKELNAWASLRKTCQYRGEEEERKDFHVYRNKVTPTSSVYSLYILTIFSLQSKDDKLKKKLMPSLFEKPEAEPGESSGNSKDPSDTSSKKRKMKEKSTNAVPSEEKTENPPAKKSKSDGEVVVGANSNIQKRKKNKKKRKTNSDGQPAKQTQKSSVIKINKISAAFSGQNKAKQQNNSSKKQPEDLLKFSDDRLKAYGVNPNQFKRKMRNEKFKQKAAGSKHKS